jgi:hypothetical protein
MLSGGGGGGGGDFFYVFVVGIPTTCFLDMKGLRNLVQGCF